METIIYTKVSLYCTLSDRFYRMQNVYIYSIMAYTYKWPIVANKITETKSKFKHIIDLISSR